MSGLMQQLKRDVKSVAKDVEWLKRKPAPTNENSANHRLDELAEMLDKIDSITAVGDWMTERSDDNCVYRELKTLAAKKETLHQTMDYSRISVDWHYVSQVLSEISTILAQVSQSL